jgi:CRP-like cAMP-binding protein
VKGEVEIRDNDRWSRPRRIARVGRRGDYFGEIGLLQEHGKRIATVVATGSEAAELLVIPAALIGDSFLGFANQLISDSRLAFGGISDASSDPCARRFHGV